MQNTFLMMIEDNDPKHISKVAKNWKNSNDINRMTWPSNSPDLNPIQNLWRIIKYQVTMLHPKNAKEHQDSIRLVWKSLPKNLAWNLVNSMPTRMQNSYSTERRLHWLLEVPFNISYLTRYNLCPYSISVKRNLCRDHFEFDNNNLHTIFK